MKRRTVFQACRSIRDERQAILRQVRHERPRHVPLMQRMKKMLAL